MRQDKQLTTRTATLGLLARLRHLLGLPHKVVQEAKEGHQRVAWLEEAPLLIHSKYIKPPQQALPLEALAERMVLLGLPHRQQQHGSQLVGAVVEGLPPVRLSGTAATGATKVLPRLVLLVVVLAATTRTEPAAPVKATAEQVVEVVVAGGITALVTQGAQVEITVAVAVGVVAVETAPHLALEAMVVLVALSS